MRTYVSDRSRPRDLSRKELCSLDCVARGMTADEGAVLLGIGRSTFAKHLANARAKLQVSRTVEAVALCTARGLIGAGASVDPIGPERGKDAVRAIEDLECDLQSCLSFRQAWTVMTRHTGRLGVASVHFAVLAEPRGQFTNGGRMVSMSLPSELARLYASAGGINADPFAAWVARQGGAMILTLDRVPPGFRSGFSPAMRRFATAMPDHGYRIAYGTALRDPWTGAGFAMPFGVRSQAGKDMQRHTAHFMGLQRALSQTFWTFLQDRSLLADLVPLSPRTRAALQDAARGLNATESAERMGISRRSVEMLLAKGSDVFAAPTTSAAIYRACVYRALTWIEPRSPTMPLPVRKPRAG
ncbi:autoinducer binding domain-containing protein [Paracoccus tegillarcae]|nr:autoinducer binding domain-containing protein [Paracoccus tegillarcae]